MLPCNIYFYLKKRIMFFLSYYYLIFLTIIFLLYYLINNKYKFYVLFIASIVFITAISLRVALFAILFTILNYFLGLLLDKHSSKPNIKIKLFWTSIILDVGILSFFKFFNFFSESINPLFSLLNIHAQVPYLNVIIPIGISYYTFRRLVTLSGSTAEAKKPSKILLYLPPGFCSFPNFYQVR